MTEAQKDNFSRFYESKRIANLYPTEFVIRILLGNYPNLSLPKNNYKGSNILDIGFGDGRNFPLLHDIGMRIHGVETDPPMIEAASARFAHMQPVLKTGSNSSIPFDDSYFDYILACHSCYYVNDGETFDDNLREIARVTKSGGSFIFSIPKPTNYLLDGATNKGDGHYIIQNDPYNLRNGTTHRAFASKEEVSDTFAPYFADCRLSSFEVDYFGIFMRMWLGVATRIE